VARDAPRLIPARNRLPSYAVWDLAVFVLNVLAFVLIGCSSADPRPARPGERVEYFQVAAIVLGICIAAGSCGSTATALVAR
jgi:CPA1 family monovalent cation:H+ antiporter